MDVNKIVLILTCAFSGISLIISALSLVITRKISINQGYQNIITSSRAKWAEGLQSNGSSYLSIIDSILLRDENSIQKYEELLKYQYAITISLFNYDDDREIKESMRKIQAILYEYLTSSDTDNISEKMEEVKRLKEYIFLILNKKYEQEWTKQKFEVGDRTYQKQQIKQEMITPLFHKNVL